MSESEKVNNYELIAVRNGRKLERFGSLRIERPCIADGSVNGKTSEKEIWLDIDLSFDGASWVAHTLDGKKMLEVGYSIDFATTEGCWTAFLKPTPVGHLGIFPEHFQNFERLFRRIKSCKNDPDSQLESSAELLHLFAYTGLGSIQCAAAGFVVTHVDSSRPAIQWGKLNQELNHERDCKAAGNRSLNIRWILEDAVSFCRREVRRGRKYQVICLDPPTFGHGHGTQTWRLERDLPILCESLMKLLHPTAWAFMITGHSEIGLFQKTLKQPIFESINQRFPKKSWNQVAIEPSRGGEPLAAGYCQTWWR